MIYPTHWNIDTWRRNFSSGNITLLTWSIMPHSKPNRLCTKKGGSISLLSDILLMTSFRFLFVVQWTSFHESFRFISNKMRKVTMFSPFFKKIAICLVLPEMSADESWPNFESKLDWNRIVFRFRSSLVSTSVKVLLLRWFGRFSRNRSTFISHKVLQRDKVESRYRYFTPGFNPFSYLKLNGLVSEQCCAFYQLPV